jgi:hypothetical protein
MAAAPLAFALAQQEVALLRGELSAIAAERGELAAERAALRVERERARSDVESALAARDGLLRRAEEAEAEAARLRAASTAVRLPPEVVPLRQLLDARGLRGDDEMGRAISAIVEGRRSRELLDALVLADGSAFSELLDDRVLLVQAGEEVPNGLVGATVGADRSESADNPAVRTAVSRLATAFLVHGLRRLVVIGGPGALLRVLHDALDPRIELRLLPAPSGSGVVDVAPGSVVVLWGAAADDRQGSYLVAE